jgi:hypothetical protein
MALATPGSNPFSKTSMAVRCRRARVRRAASLIYGFYVTWVRVPQLSLDSPLSARPRVAPLNGSSRTESPCWSVAAHVAKGTQS